MNLRKALRINKKLTLSINRPLISEGIILTNYYEELQKNSWANLIEDDTKNLVELIRGVSISERPGV